MEFRERETQREQEYERYGHEYGGESGDYAGTRAEVSQSGLATFIGQVYLWMFAGLTLTAATSGIILSSKVLMYHALNVMFPLMIIKLIAVYFLAARVHKLQPSTCALIFLGYSFSTGVVITPILYAYSDSHIATTFMITAGTFGIMAFYGLTTKKDLTSMGHLLMQALLGLILVAIVNMFMASAPLQMAIQCVGVLIFVGLVAWDNQNIKHTYVEGLERSSDGTKFAIMAALELYLDFINLFLFLIQLLASSDD